MASAGDAAQGILAALDSGMNRAWREEDAAWRAHIHEARSQDVEWMRVERRVRKDDAELRASKRWWRQENLEYRNLENARCLWLRFVERNRRDVEEKSELLKAVSNLSALFAGFAIVTLTQFQPQMKFSKALFGVYGVLTAVVEGLMIMSMVTCTLILGSILKIGRTYVNEEAEEEFIFSCLDFCRNYNPGDHPPAPRRTLEAFWYCRCETTWQQAFHSFSFGVSLFLLSMIVIGWIKYSGESQVTAILFISLCAIAIVLWFIVQYAWGEYFRRRKITHASYNTSSEEKGLPYAWYLAPIFDESQATMA
ncbi:uncharacterized protein LOC9644061 [Selaginella moellendorffii]|nr:uncharacterized protein LOC9644061 [Selaginella moellendorffii]|eukprot:XP_002984461.2 uncharacterized protein LOC9644061 [Selaginella moellendorffii]